MDDKLRAELLAIAQRAEPSWGSAHGNKDWARLELAYRREFPPAVAIELLTENADLAAKLERAEAVLRDAKDYIDAETRIAEFNRKNDNSRLGPICPPPVQEKQRFRQSLRAYFNLPPEESK